MSKPWGTKTFEDALKGMLRRPGPDAQMVADVLAQLADAELTPEGEDEVERVMAAWIAWKRQRRAAANWRREWDRHAPLAQDAAWPLVDHAYRLGRGVYVAEPYSVGGRGIQQLAELDRAGWSVLIDARQAMWFPGHTVAVRIKREGTP